MAYANLSLMPFDRLYPPIPGTRNKCAGAQRRISVRWGNNLQLPGLGHMACPPRDATCHRFFGHSYCNSLLTPTSGTMSARHDAGHYNGLTKMRLKGGPQCPVLRRWFLSHLITDSRQPQHGLGDTRQLTNTILVWSLARGL